VINASDAIFSQLRVWQDANQNGVGDAGELKTLAEAGITLPAPRLALRQPLAATRSSGPVRLPAPTAPPAALPM
jgi:hypothetical protein